MSAVIPKTGSINSHRLQNKVAIVTGASSGIGRAVAKRFAAEGAHVVAFARSKDKLDSLVQEITDAKGSAIAVVGDVTKSEDLKAVVDTAVAKFGGLHIAFNNAGIFKGGAKISEEKSTASLWDEVMDANAKSVFLSMHHQIPAIVKSGGGSIINNSSGLGDQVSTLFSGGSVYAASKAAVNMISKYAAMEQAGVVRVNVVAPAVVTTSVLGDSASAEVYEQLGKAAHLVPRAGHVDEIAPLVAYLASDESSFVTGSVFTIDGGASLK